MSRTEKRVVITGLGVVCPIGTNVADFWDSLEQGHSGVRRLDHPLLENFHVQIGATVTLPAGYQAPFRQKKLLDRMDRFVVLGACAGMQAIADSGLEIDADPTRYGAIIASGEGGLDTHYGQITQINEKGLNFISPFYVSNVIPNTASAVLSIERNLQGPSFSVNSACASSNHALGLAASLIRMGMAEAIFAGGSESVLTMPSMACFGIMGALSQRNDDPLHASRPFDRDRDGFVMGEGAGVLCLEELEHAKKRGAKIYGELTGFGFTSDAYNLVSPHPEGLGAARAMTDSLRMAGITAEQVGLINCHGTSTPAGDKIESLAIHHALGAYASRVPVHSTKSMTGHLIGGTSAVEAIADLMCFERGVIHPSVNVENQDPAIDLHVIKERTDASGVDHVLSNAFGFGGHNACVVLSRFK